jgi:hypothetical protein
VARTKGARKELRRIGRLLASGYELEQTGADHVVVVGPDGPLRLPDGRAYTMPCTPGGTFRFDKVERFLRDAGAMR